MRPRGRPLVEPQLSVPVRPQTFQFTVLCPANGWSPRRCKIRDPTRTRDNSPILNPERENPILVAVAVGTYSLLSESDGDLDF